MRTIITFRAQFSVCPTVDTMSLFEMDLFNALAPGPAMDLTCRPDSAGAVWLDAEITWPDEPAQDEINKVMAAILTIDPHCKITAETMQDDGAAPTYDEIDAETTETTPSEK